MVGLLAVGCTPRTTTGGGNETTQAQNPYNPTSQTNVAEIDPITVALTIAFPVFVICAIVGYQKYRVTALQRRIKRLNQIWQLDALKKLS
jgi:hypothetical protein